MALIALSATYVLHVYLHGINCAIGDLHSFIFMVIINNSKLEAGSMPLMLLFPVDKTTIPFICMHYFLTILCALMINLNFGL